MKTNLSIGLLCGLLALLVGLPSRPGARPAVAQDRKDQEPTEPITVRLASGRTFTAELDRRTDLNRLWLRFTRGSAVLLRPIEWDRVMQARIAGEDLSGNELREMVEQIRRENPFREEPAAGQRRLVIKGSGPPAFAEATDVVPEPFAAMPVRSLLIDAEVANWDADVEVDGLVVHVYPLAGSGEVVPARGTLAVDLTGRPIGAAGRNRPFTNLGRWSRQVRPEHFGPRGAVYRLPFQGTHPEFDQDMEPYGAVHARLSVPGHGTFETTQSTIRIRPYSAVRDELQLTTGRRFFPQERTGRGRR